MLYRAVIVEDDPMVALLDRTYVERDPRFRVVQTFQDGRAALEWLEQNPAELAVLDVYMPLLTGAELLRELRRRGIGIDAVMVTAANDSKTVDALLKLGVADYLVAQSALDRLFSSAPAGERQIPKGLQESTLEKVRACLRQAPPQGLPSEALSRATGLSAVTVRRYVNYLVERGEAVSTVNYDTGGRPCRLYRTAGGAE